MRRSHDGCTAQRTARSTPRSPATSPAQYRAFRGCGGNKVATEATGLHRTPRHSEIRKPASGPDSTTLHRTPPKRRERLRNRRSQVRILTGALLREPRGFEGLLSVRVIRDADDPAAPDRSDLCELHGNWLLAATTSPSLPTDGYHLITGVEIFVNAELVVRKDLPPLHKKGKYGLATTNHGLFGPASKAREVPFNLGVVEQRQFLRAAPIPRSGCSTHDLHVFLRHRPRSIACPNRWGWQQGGNRSHRTPQDSTTLGNPKTRFRPDSTTLHRTPPKRRARLRNRRSQVRILTGALLRQSDGSLRYSSLIEYGESFRIVK